MSKIDYARIDSLLKEMSIDNKEYQIKYEMYPIHSRSVYEEKGSKLVTVKSNVEVLIKNTGERLRFPVDLLKLPHYGATGFVINGKNRQVIDLYTISYGWYKLPANKDVKSPHLKLTSERGKNIVIFEKDYELYITFSKRGSVNEAVPLSVFLKAFTGSSFKEISSKIGEDNIYVASSFNKEEPLQTECIREVLKRMFGEFRSGSKSEELENMGTDIRYSYAYSRIFSPRYMTLGETAGIRLKSSLTFKERCRNMILAEDLVVGDKVFKKNTVLDVKVLEELDYSPVNSLKVFNGKGSIFTVRKNSIYNFRALGMEVAEDISRGDLSIEKGKILSIADLKRLEDTDLDSISVLKDGKVSVVSRKIYQGVLDVEDIISMVQVYVDTLGGLEKYDNIYDLSNQNLVTIDIRALTVIKSYCRDLNYYLQSYILDNRDEKEDLLKRIMAFPGFDTDLLINEISSVENRESQSAELNNVIQKISKEHRAAKNVSRSSEGMIGIQESQFGRLDPIDSPESEKIGRVHYKTWLSKVNSAGFMCAPFIRVEDGKIVSDEPVYLTVTEQQDQFIAEWNETFFEVDSNGNKVKKKKVMALCNSTFMEVPVEDISYKEYSPYQTMSPARMQVPFQEHSNPKRILMGSNHQKQTIRPLYNERPIVSSGGDSLIKEGIIRASDVLRDYYDANSSFVKVDKSEFLKQKIKIKSVDIRKGYRDVYFEIMGLSGHIPMVSIPFIQKSASGAWYFYKINGTEENLYSGRDIVAYSADTDISKKEVFKHTDFGSMKVDDSVFDEALGLAKNLLIGYKTHESSTIDDAIVINADLIGTNAMTTVELHKVSYKLIDDITDEKGFREFEEFSSLKKVSHMNSNGLPKLGTILSPGDVVIGIKKVKTKFTKGKGIELLSQFDKSKKLEGTVEGQVVECYIENNEAIVMLASLKPIEKGDKLAGRYGNKGVVAKILPREYMPFDPKTGEVLDVILSPLGVPSRSNISQVLEVVLGYAMKKLGKICVVSPYKGDTLKFVKNVAKQTDVKPTRLRDGRTGQYFDRPINVGIMYILKLEHMVSHKIKSVGLSNKTDPVFSQPTKGAGQDSGQAFGEYESWCLMSVGANKVLQDLYSVQSDDVYAIHNLRDAVNENPSSLEIEGNNRNDQLFKVLFRSMCVEPIYDGENGFAFRPMTDRMIRGLSATPVDINNKDSIRSTTIFGNTTNNFLKYGNRDTWSWIPLHCEMVHPFWIIKGKIDRFIICTVEEEKKGKFTSTTKSISQTELRSLISGKYYLKSLDPITIVKGTKEGYDTGMPALVKIMRSVNFDDAIKYYESLVERKRKESNILTNKKILRGILELKASGIKPEDFIISSLPIMPLSFRPPSMFRNSFQDFDFYYRRIIDEVSRSRMAKSTLDYKSIYKIYCRIIELCGLPYGGEVERVSNYKNILGYFVERESSKASHGRVRENLLKKRIFFSGRAVIVPNSNLKRLPTQIGVPFLMCIRIWRPQLISLLNKTLEEWEISKGTWEDILDVMGSNEMAFKDITYGIRDKLGLTSTEVYDKIYSVIKTYVEGRKDKEGNWEVTPRVVLAGRQPSLHKYSIRAYYPVMVDGKCIEIHPLVCKGYNADFDGDQAWVAGLVNDSACEEALEKLSPMHGVINTKDSSVVLEHSQDMRLGIYYATMLYDNKESIEGDNRYEEVRHYSNLRTLETDVDIGIVSVHDLVCLSYGEYKYLSTAGRILFNSLLPNGLGFTDHPYSNVLGIKEIGEVDDNFEGLCIDPSSYKDLRFDGLVSGKGGTRKEPVYVHLDKVTLWSYNNLSPEKNIEVFQKIAEFGFKFSDRSGVSFLLEDLEQNPSTGKYLDIAKEKAAEINQRYYDGVISDSVRKETLIALYEGCLKIITKTFMSEFSRNNNIFLMFDSGARGSEGQIMQAVGVIGVLQKSKNEVLEVPVLSNYARGNTSFETLLLSFSTRTGVASTQNETATSGELTRMAVYMASGISIVEEDCGRDFEDFKLKWDKPTGKVLDPSGNGVTIDSLEGKILSEEDENTMKILRSYIGNSRELTKKCLSMILKKRVHKIICEDGEYRVFYTLDSLYRGILLNRYAEDLPNLTKDSFISEASIKHIEENNLQSVKVRTLLGCESVGGVCAHCYGLKYDSLNLPKVGDKVGIESAQSIGEPASQLTLSLFHQGGAAGAGIDQGVDLIKSLLETGRPKGLKGSVLSESDGYVKIDSSLDNQVQILREGQDPLFVKVEGDLLVEDGEYVEKNDPLTSGFVVAEEQRSPSLDDVRFSQMSMLELYFRTFELSNIKVNVRHFEIFVRGQNSLVDVVESDNPYFKEGMTYELNEVLQKGDSSVKYLQKWESSKNVIPHYGGVETFLAHGEFSNRLGVLVSSQYKSKGKSPIGDLFYGQDVTGTNLKVLLPPKEIEGEEDNRDVSLDVDLKSGFVEDLIREVEKEDLAADIDLDELLDSDLTKPEDLGDDSYINLEEEEKEKEVSKVRKMDVF